MLHHVLFYAYICHPYENTSAKSDSWKERQESSVCGWRDVPHPYAAVQTAHQSKKDEGGADASACTDT